MHFLKYPNNFSGLFSRSLFHSRRPRFFISLHPQILKNYHKPHKPWPKPPDYKKRRLIFTYYNVGLYCLVFGICYSIVPLYKLFCEHVGLEGDLEQKDYGNMTDKKRINFFYFLGFFAVFNKNKFPLKSPIAQKIKSHL